MDKKNLYNKNKQENKNKTLALPAESKATHLDSTVLPPSGGLLVAGCDATVTE